MRPLPLAIARSALLAAAFVAPACGAAAPPAFTLVVVAPEPVGSLRMQRLTLGRYREVTDLDEAELARLLALAQRDARRLLGTLGFFDPRIDIVHDTSVRPPHVTLRVNPGEATVVDAVRIAFEGEIATTPDADAGPTNAQAAEAADRRAAIRAQWRLAPGRRWTQAD